MSSSFGVGKRITGCVVLAAIALLALVVWSPSASARVKYLGRASCNVYEWASDSVCYSGDLPGAHLRVWGRDEVHYSVCITAPKSGTQCKRRTTGSSGQRSSVAVPTSELGRYLIVWRVHGRIKASASFKLKSEGV
jgi:hypothetical protein